MAQAISTALSSHGQPFGANALQWLENAYNGQDAAAMIAAIGSTYDPATVYILYGAELSSTGGNTTVTDGYAFVGGSFYEMVSNTYVDPSGGNTNIIVLQTTYGDGLGTTFADSSVANVLINQKFTFQAGTSGTSGYIGDYVGAVPIQIDGVLNPIIGAVSGTTLHFNRNKYLASISSPTGGAYTINLNGTNARAGVEVVLAINVASGDVITLTTGGGLSGYLLLTGTASLTATHTTQMYMRFKMLTNKIVSVEIFNNA